jgi:3-phenylpropionate/cinnamic acid dioxygenase small subunit
LTKRVEQIRTGIHWAEEPLSRVAHVISNIRLVEPVCEIAEGASAAVKCRFLVYRNRLETETDFLVGRREDVLRRVQGSLKIARRKILIEQSVLLAKNLTVFL